MSEDAALTGGVRPDAVERWALELLRTSRVGHLGTAGSDGRPLVVPVCFALLEQTETLEAVSAVDRKPKAKGTLRRLRDLSQNPRATLLVDVWDEDWSRLRWVRIEGVARVLQPDDEPSAARRSAALRALEAKYPQYGSLPLDPRTPIVALRAETVRSWRFDADS